MKKQLLLLAAAIGLVACGQTPKPHDQSPPQPDRVEVLSFHGKQRCVTCVAIETLTKEVVETQFAAQLADSSLVFRVIDIAQDETSADRYEVTWSSLLVNRWRDGTESVRDLTDFAFANARTNPEHFKTELTARINELLNP